MRQLQDFVGRLQVLPIGSIRAIQKTYRDGWRYLA